MTSSVLSAGLFSFMCYALPVENGCQIMKGPSPKALLFSPSEDEAGSDPTDSDEQREKYLDAKTLVMGQTSPSNEEPCQWELVETL